MLTKCAKTAELAEEFADEAMQKLQILEKEIKQSIQKLNQIIANTSIDSEPRYVTQETLDRLNSDVFSDSGSHYRKTYQSIQLDPYRIADIYNISDAAVFHAIKKLLAAGERGNKDFKQDILEARDALNRQLEMLVEDQED